MSNIEFIVGQKWISNAEPELAMGRVVEVEHRTISIRFDAADELRTYAKQQAPLSRVKFNPDDEIRAIDGTVLVVTSVDEMDGLIEYHGSEKDSDAKVVVLETELDPNVRFSKPQDRLFTQQIDKNTWFDLRYQSLSHVSRLAEARSRGLYGARASLIPHQLYIAHEVAGRFAPRVLLADEVGLGKTIEAGLIVHQQLQTGRASRVLIIVPPALTFQWFIEMVRRFNLKFTVMDEERCQQISADNYDESLGADERQSYNPFDAQQLMLCSLDLFTDNADRLEQVIDTDLDLVVVDEAHHLTWTPEESSIEYDVVSTISSVTQGLLLLTATPEQLGPAGHFARLKLLDPDRFHSYDVFSAEEAKFESVAQSANQLLDGTDDEKSAARASISQLVQLADADDTDLIGALLDRHGTGRVLFRNVRQTIKGFTERLPIATALTPPEAYQSLDSYFPQQEVPGWETIDPRIDWLLALLNSRPNDKFLLICAHQQTVVTLEKRLAELSAIRTTVFHEGMDLIKRDRAAFYFSETIKGAQLMICSEIGSEGRNFQFASDLVLFDLPLGPDLLEQRIGRLDRIGQKKDVTIHIPYFEGQPSERLYQLYDHGLGVFSGPNPVAQSIYDALADTLLDRPMDELLSQAQALNQSRLEVLNRGRDKLLELNSHRAEVSAEIVNDINLYEGGRSLERYMELSFRLFGLESEDGGNHVVNIKPTQAMVRNDSVSLETLDHFAYPELPEEGIRITYDRNTALAIEDVGFFTWEHPLVQQALDLAISDIRGNSTMIAIKHPRLKAGTLLVETLHVVACAAPKYLMVDKYLPPRIIRGLIDPNLADHSAVLSYKSFAEEKIKVPRTTLIKILESQKAVIQTMLDKSVTLANDALSDMVTQAQGLITTKLGQEVVRLDALRQVNNNVRIDEIDHLRATQAALSHSVQQAGVRLDAIRVIVCA